MASSCRRWTQRRHWSFVPQVQTGAKLCAGDTLGLVQEGAIRHRIMVPFDEPGEVEVAWSQEGNVAVDTLVASIQDQGGQQRSITLTQRWPMRRPIPERLLAERRCKCLYPSEPWSPPSAP